VTKDRTSSVARADSDGASTMDLSGRCVGSSYILLHPIGQGATGTVWRGLDRSSGEPVAVKLLHESLLRQPKLVTRFVQERTILLMLRHRNVVRVRDLFSVGETLGLVMDLVDGGSLRDHLREHHTVPAGEAARLAAQVAAALAEAHELGVIHRDLKPDNILLRAEGGRLDTRLTDFGVARILNTPSMTTPNAVVGTPHYMAPEAFHGTTASPATDVYALGVVLYELVTGRPPYDSDSIPDLMRRHMEGDPPRPPGIADPIWEVIASCMATKPRLRPSAAELVAALSDVSRDCAAAPALPRAAPASPPSPENNDEPDPVSVVPLPRKPDRGNAAPSWRWGRPGVTMTVIAGAMLASAVAATALHFGRAEGRPALTPQILAAPSAPDRPHHGTAGVRTSQRVTPAPSAVPPQPAAQDDPIVARSPAGVRARTKKAATRPPQPEAKPYGPWQCTQGIAFQWSSKIALATKPCRMTGKDIQYQASVTAPGGGTGSITVSLQDAASGRTVDGPKTCDGLTFGGDASTRNCGPSGASPARGHQYAVVMSYRYVRDGQTLAGAAKGSAFAW
jgi:serine/threonine-protein kinase